ncbi:nuclear GTPase SLIP-GC-like [Oxyura jamaicensis]|uniref:nuclear GTPase SLIP-GC-like n=1 Tax=Oxyura jamaicensis TaxID=8884 RepID=UPI0015A6FDCB|nr:nuclear GTPase SLIP-GC-like [Oxyura jamaicensis]
MAECHGAENNNAAEVTQKRPRMQEAFQQEERETLRKYEKMEDRVRKIQTTSCEKISSLFFMKDMPGHLVYLRDRITTLSSKLAFEPIRIGLFGSSGAGKSTLLNTILHERFFLPVSGTRACTSCQVQISTCRSRQYKAKIFLLSQEEWMDEVKSLVTLLETEREDGENDSDTQHAVRVLRAVYGEGAEKRSYEDLMKAKPDITIPSSRVITLTTTEAEALSRELDPYIRNQDGSEGFEVAPRSEQMRLWPLIKYIQVTLPTSDIVPEGVIFVDIPGMGDSNTKRDEMWKESILECTSIWVIADVERVFGASAHENMLKEAITACLIGKCSDITFVITKMDKIDLDEYLRNHPSASKSLDTRNAILETKKDLKTKKTRAIRDRMQRRLPSDTEVLQKSDLVFTVSAKEYWNPTVLMKEETEISRLRDQIRKLCLNVKRNQLQEHMKEILVLFSLVDVYHALQLNPGPTPQQDELNAFVLTKIQELKKNAQSIFDQMDLPLIKGVKSAKSSHKKNIGKIFAMGEKSKGFHRTLKAACRRNGLYVSRIFHRVDINNCLAEPIYMEIDMMFKNIFRKQMLTRISLQAAVNEFSSEVKGKFTTFATDTNMNESKLKFLIQETDIIMRALEREILLKKKTIYESLALSIQSTLTPYYQEAAKISGKETYKQMKSMLTQNIELEVRQAMFEKAKEKMMSQFQDLTEQMTTKLSKDFLDMLSVVFSHCDTPLSTLPVLQEECQEVLDLLRNL